MLRDFNVNHIDLLKIDVEGFEEKVLRGSVAPTGENRQVALELKTLRPRGESRGC